MHVERRVRGWISILVWLLVAMPEAHSAFLVEFQNKRESIQAHSILSANTTGVILRPVGGGFGNGVRHRWDEFSARTLGVLMSELLEDPLFNQKSREVKFKIMESIEVARRGKAPEKPDQPIRPLRPLLPQPVSLTNAPSPPAVNPGTGIPTPQPAVVPTNSLPALPKPTVVAPVKPITQPATNVATAPASVLQLAEPPGVAPFPERRPPASGLSSETMVNPSGIFLTLLVMALSGYAGYEIARFKKRPVKLVCALSAMLPVLGPAVFLALPPQNSSEATQFASPGVPGAPDMPGTTPPAPLPAVKELKYEDDPDSPYANLTAGGVEETQFVEESVAVPPAVAKSLEHYHASEYEFTPAFFSQYFAQFVGAAATTGEALILRSNSDEYPVHYISSVDVTGLQIIYAANGQWVQQFLTYADLTEVEVLGHA